MYKIGPYQSIRHIAEAGLLECPFKCSLCGTCMYHNFCSYVTTAFTEARRLSEIDPTVKSIIDEAYKKRDKEVSDNEDNKGLKEAVHNKWEFKKGNGYAKCPVCYHLTTCWSEEELKDYNYCYYCGTKLESGAE